MQFSVNNITRESSGKEQEMDLAGPYLPNRTPDMMNSCGKNCTLRITIIILSSTMAANLYNKQQTTKTTTTGESLLVFVCFALNSFFDTSHDSETP